ncbi:hypothetical protein [Brevundimonas sp. FT23042]|uniref:hypothetical protein n=1 Tax=Brevundimonas sp. FT23042 TaxID=3393749 RepID=UPI003B585D2D
MLAGLLVTALLLQQPAPAPSAADDDYVRDAFIRRLDYVIFHQPIDDENVERVARLLQPGDILDLQSQGGTVRASLRFGELVMDRVIRVRVTGECASGCSLVWAVARDRLDNGFVGATFHGTPISAWTWASENPEYFSAAELTLIENENAVFRDFLAKAGLQPWLFECAYRLQNIRQNPVLNPAPGQPRFRPEGDYTRVWFPAGILTQAGVRGLDRYDPPNPRQRLSIETGNGTRPTPLPVYWASDGDCDPDIAAAGQGS